MVTEHVQVISKRPEKNLLCVAGMVPFKPYFLGVERPPHPNVVTVQKCVRAGGMFPR
jgi:alanyl-tRNA synthetase